MVYDDRHRAFLQAVMQNGVVLDHDAQLLCSKIFKEKVTVSSIAALINQKLAAISMSLKFGICEITGDMYWSVVSTIYEEKISMPSEFGIAQRAFLREICSEIIRTEDRSISSTDCLNLSRNLGTKLAMGDADKFLKDMFKGKWLFIKNGHIYMGVRSIMELMPYFRATYENIFHNCFLCKEIIFHGLKCENCDKDFHLYCMAKYAHQQNNNTCPQCKHRFNNNELQNESVAIDAVNREEVDHDEPMDIPDDSEIEDSPPIRKSRKRTKKRSS